MGSGAHADKAGYVLEGGVYVHAKIDNGQPEASEMVHAEVAAWRVVRALEWPDLMPATILREVPYGGSYCKAAVQIVWQFANAGEPLTTFSDEEKFRAAIVDAVILHADRHPTNWLAVDSMDGSRKVMKLIDNGYAFGVGGRPSGSEPVQAMTGQPLADSHCRALQLLISRLDTLSTLLDPARVDAVRQRAQHLVTQRLLGVV